MVTFDHPRRHALRRLRWTLAAAAAVGMVAAAAVALVVAVPTSFLVLGLVVVRLAPGDDAASWPPQDVPVDEVVVAWALSTAVAVLGLVVGLRLLRRGRHVVLFLRRFGYDDATRAVTAAVTATLGRRWRLVTLDDDEIAPVGVATGVRLLVRVGEAAARAVGPVVLAVVRGFAIAAQALVAVAALAVWRSGVLHGAESASLDPYIEVLEILADGRLPLDAVGPDLPGLFALVGSVFAVFAVLGAAAFVGALMAVPLAGVLTLVASASAAAEKAEAARTGTVASPADVGTAVARVAALGERVLAPRLVVLRVATGVWQRTVQELAEVASVALIDVSEPTEHLLWEIEALEHHVGVEHVLIGHHERVSALARPPVEAHHPGSFSARLTSALSGQEILAYTSDPRVLRRFARELRDRLVELSVAQPAEPARRRRRRPGGRPRRPGAGRVGGPTPELLRATVRGRLR